MKLFIILCLTVSGIVSGSVILDVGPGTVVKTTENGSVMVDRLVETDTGLFEGQITSGPQTGITEFAGMSLGSGLTGSITRMTVDSAGSGTSDKAHVIQYYKISNISGSDLLTNMRIKPTLESGTRKNSLNIRSVHESSSVKKPVLEVFGSQDTIAGVTIPAGNSEWRLTGETLPTLRKPDVAAESTCEGVTLTWVKGMDHGSEGFHVLRSECSDGDYEQLTAGPVPVQENDSSGTEYTYLDKTVASEMTYYYKIQKKAADGSLSEYGPVEVVSCFIPMEYALFQNYPNPFNPCTTIQYQIPEPCFVSLKIYDILGREVYAPVHEKKTTGAYKIQWNAGSLSSGMYIYRLEAGKYTETRKLIVKK